MTRTPAQRTARFLLELEALAIRPDEPFLLGSGRRSPVHVDCRRLISFPRTRRALTDLAVERLGETVGLEAFDAVAGAETAGIPYAAWLADRLMLPMLYVRKSPKGFGRNARIEGRLQPGQRVLLVDDLTTDGQSKLAFADALREAGAVVEHAFVLFFFDIFPAARSALAEAGLSVHGLATMADLLEEARAMDTYPPDVLDEIGAFVSDAAAWSVAHGGTA